MFNLIKSRLTELGRSRFQSAWIPARTLGRGGPRASLLSQNAVTRATGPVGYRFGYTTTKGTPR
jgi:hypothetical protein